MTEISVYLAGGSVIHSLFHPAGVVELVRQAQQLPDQCWRPCKRHSIAIRHNVIIYYVTQIGKPSPVSAHELYKIIERGLL